VRTAVPLPDDAFGFDWTSTSIVPSLGQNRAVSV
jgi:hypothetical protein